MKAKKIVFVVGWVLTGLMVLTAIFVAAIVYFGLYSVNRSEPAEKAKAYLRSNEKLKQDIGDVQNIGNIDTVGISDRNGNSEVTLKLKVFGKDKTVNATVNLMLVPGNAWRITSASYVNSNGQTVKLLDPYETNNGGNPLFLTCSSFSKVLIPGLIA